MIKKIFKLIAAAQAVAFPAVGVPVQKAEEPDTTLEETNIVFQNSIVDSLYISNPKNTADIIQVVHFQEILSLSPVTDLSKKLYFSGSAEADGHAYNGLGILSYGSYSTFEKNVLTYVDTSNLITFVVNGNRDYFILFGDIKNVPQEYINKNVLVKFKMPMKVNYIAPGLEKYFFNPKPVDKFALTFNGLLNGYSYNMIGGREDIDPSYAYEYIKNHAQLITDTNDWWNGLTMFRVATFKNGSETFDIVGIVSGPGDVGLFTNYQAPNHAKLKELVSYSKEADNSYTIFATHQISIEGYYACTIVDKTAASFVLTSGPDFSSFLDYAKEVGYPEGYAQGRTDGENNPTFKSFIVSAFEACSAFFSLPVLGQNITVGTLIGSFVGLGALFLLIKLFR